MALPDGGPTDELEEMVWLPLAEAKQADIPTITRTVLESSRRRLREDPLLRREARCRSIRMVRNRFVRDIL